MTTALIRWEPFREIETVQRKMNRLFNQILTDDSACGGISGSTSFIPTAEIHQLNRAS